MLKFSYRFLPILCVVAMLYSPAAPACNVPVFRYALERWEADQYEIVVFHRGALTSAQQALLDTLEHGSSDEQVNVVISRVNLAEEMTPRLRTLWEVQDHAEAPWMVANYPRQMQVESSVWAGPLNAETVKGLLDSPARRELSQKLLQGESIIWLLLESGDQRRDDAIAKIVEAESRKLEETLALPEPSPLDPPTSTAVPLKMAFSTLRLARSNPAERLLVNMLLNWDSKLAATKEAMLFPIFGRGRMTPPAIGEEIGSDSIREMAEFLTGACSCEVKELNPGHDLLISADWNSLAGYQEVMLPDLPLVGMSQFANPDTNNLAKPAQATNVTLATVGTTPGEAGQSPLARNVAIVVGIGVLFLTATTLVQRARANRGPR